MKIPLPRNFNPPKALKVYDYYDVTINLFAASIQPHQFSLKKLQEKKIIPPDWQLKKPVRKKADLLYLSFVEGLNITITKGKVVFVQKLMNKTSLEKIIKQFIIQFKNFKYNKLQIVLRRIITLPTKINSSSKFIKNILLNGSEWDILGHKPKRQINYYYSNFSLPLIINMVDLPLKNHKIKSKSCLLIRGIFEKKIGSKQQNDNLLLLIDKYRDHIDIFNKVVDRDILNR